MLKIWGLINGKKRQVAQFYWLFVVPTIALLYPQGAPARVATVVAIVGLFLTAIGYGHAVIKSMAQKLESGVNNGTNQLS
jgi:hypothetical protein